MKDVQIRREDFAEWDWETVDLAGASLLGVVADVAFHCTNPGEGWDPLTSAGDVPALIAEVRGYVERLEEAINKTRKDLADVERNARLTAMRRQRRQAKEAEENG